MSDLTLAAAHTFVAAVLETVLARGLKPLCVVVDDARGTLKCLASKDGTLLRRAEIARAKANGCLKFGLGRRALMKRAQEQAYFLAAVSHLAGPNTLVPVPGGTWDNDEICTLAGIIAADLVAETGA